MVDAEHFVATRSASFRWKVRWFGNILRHEAARIHLWQLYYAGEAYVELHPKGVYIDRLPPWLGKLLARHLSDETRHATVFRDLLIAAGAARSLPEHEDVGWYLLTHVVPDVVERAQRPGPFSRLEAIRYMAFLHSLELRSIADLCALIEAAQQNGEPELAARFGRILQDERFHAGYTHHAVFRLAGEAGIDGRAVLDDIRRAERRHYERVLGNIIEQLSGLNEQRRTWTARLRCLLARAFVRSGLACPLLPLYDRLPARLTDREEAA